MTGSKVQRLLIDGRTFSLQTKGGVSQVWAKLLSSKEFLGSFKIYLLLYPGHEKNIHLQESNLLDDPAVVKIASDIPPSDNFNHRSPKSMERRRKLCLEGLGVEKADVVLNTYYGENVLQDDTRYVVMVHDFAHEDLEMFATRPTTKEVIARKVEAMRRATDLVYISCFSHSRALELYPDLREKRSAVIYHGHDEVPCVAFRKNSRNFVHIGTRALYKDFACVARAFEKLLPKHSDVSLLVIGGEAPDDLLEKLMKDFPNQVTFETNVPDERITNAIASSCGFISASGYEGFGIPVLNALHLGTLPIVASIPPYRELAAHYAYFFDPGNDGQLYQKLEEALSAQISETPRADRPWSSVAREYVNFIGSGKNVV